MEDTNTKTKKILSILLVIFIIFALGFLAWSYRTTIKKFFGFATVYDSIAQQAYDAGFFTNPNSYAWGESVGWIDFSSSANNPVVVADNALWGYAYGENIGWISLNCHNGQMSSTTCTNDYKVSNDGDGKLSGYAYGENVGWIHFGTTASDRPYGVTITSGDFTGYAYGENIGWVSFNSANGGSVDYKVSTNWTNEDTTPRRGKRTVVDLDKIKISSPVSGTRWTTGSTYEIKWLLPEATTTDTFVYMTGGGYEENRVIAMASSTDSFMEYYVTDEDLPKVEGTSWKIAVCSGEIVENDTSLCGFSGDFYVNSVGHKVDPINKATSSEATGSSTNNGDKTVELPPIKTVELPVVKLEPIKLAELPKFGGDTKDSFTFIPQIKSFILAPLPEEISKALDKFPKLKDYLSSVGFEREQDLIRLSVRQISLMPIPDPVPAGLFIINNGTNNLRTYLAADPNYKFAQLARIASGTPVSISLMTDKKVVGEWGGEKIPFATKDGKATLEFVSGTPGRYILTTDASPLPLAIEVLEQSKPSEQPKTGSGPGNWFTRLFGR